MKVLFCLLLQYIQMYFQIIFVGAFFSSFSVYKELNLWEQNEQRFRLAIH